MTALLVLREKVIKPVLAGTKQPASHPGPSRKTPLDVLYRTLQTDLRDLFHVLGVAAPAA
jgi:hypothetical protein